MEKKPKYEIRNLNQGNTPYRRNIIYCELYKDGEMFASCDVAFVLRSHDINMFENGKQVLREYVSFVSERLKGEDVDFDGEKFELPAHVSQPSLNATILDLKSIRNYFGEHDITPFEHWAYSFLDTLIKDSTLLPPNDEVSNGQLNYSQIESVVQWLIGEDYANYKEIRGVLAKEFKEDFSKHRKPYDKLKEVLKEKDWSNVPPRFETFKERPAGTHQSHLSFLFPNEAMKLYFDQKVNELYETFDKPIDFTKSTPPATSSNTEDEIWTLTNQLKWTKHYIDRSSTGEVDLEKLILQQLSTSNKGNAKWTDVPTE